MTRTDRDRDFMRRAIALAQRADKRVRPNPPVGCVLVRDGEVVGEGWHQQLGGPHAEVHALAAAGEKARGATAYVTLEPCNHTGRTPPCAAALLDAGVARVVIGASDPNGLAAGGGATLQASGVEVERGVEEAACEAAAEVFFANHRHGRAFVRLKVAATLDGRTSAADGTSQWITGPDARREVHRLRADADAVLVGSGTVLADDPSLNARGVACLRQPAAIVVDRRLRTPAESGLFAVPDRDVLIYTVVDHDAGARLALEERGATVIPIEAAGDAWLRTVLVDLRDRGLVAVLSEAGARVGGALLRAGLVDRLDVVLGAKLLGDGAPLFEDLGITTIGDARALAIDRVTQVGADVWISGRVPSR